MFGCSNQQVDVFRRPNHSMKTHRRGADKDILQPLGLERAEHMQHILANHTFILLPT
jgi:hypothetical protein